MAQCLHIWVITPQETTRCVPKSHLESSSLCYSEGEETNHLEAQHISAREGSIAIRSPSCFQLFSHNSPRPSTYQQGGFCNQIIKLSSYFPTSSKIHQNFTYNSRSH